LCRQWHVDEGDPCGTVDYGGRHARHGTGTGTVDASGYHSQWEGVIDCGNWLRE
jgi:hypothetical protein